MSKYNREKAIAYAHKWAYTRNPNYYNFDYVGGDCTIVFRWNEVCAYIDYCKY